MNENIRIISTHEPSIGSSTTRTISFEPKQPSKSRVITETKRWTFTEKDLDPYQQWNWILELEKQSASEYSNNSSSIKNIQTIQSLIKQKLASYRAQDILKHIYISTEFVDFEFVLNLFHTFKNKETYEFPSFISCYYCQKPVLLLYKHVRDPKQWTLERLNNTLGHNKGNVVIACLSCNLKRRIMHHERYRFTKQCSVCFLDK